MVSGFKNMKKSLTIQLAVLIAFLFIAGCTKSTDSTESVKFDPKYIATEADKGNLDPLKELNDACSAEIKKNGVRSSACNIQDQVGALRKPFKLGF